MAKEMRPCGGFWNVGCFASLWVAVGCFTEMWVALQNCGCGHKTHGQPPRPQSDCNSIPYLIYVLCSSPPHLSIPHHTLSYHTPCLIAAGVPGAMGWVGHTAPFYPSPPFQTLPHLDSFKPHNTISLSGLVVKCWCRRNQLVWSWLPKKATRLISQTTDI